MSFRFLTAGESHGKALIGILEGIPSGLLISFDELHHQMKRRKLGLGRGARQKIETDDVEILSGVRFEKTLGSPISLLIQNKDWTAWKEIMSAEVPSDSNSVPDSRRRAVSVPRPGHADLVGGIKYSHPDMRNVLERSSARETAMRVALGSIARQFLSKLGISIGSRVVRIGTAKDPSEFLGNVDALNSQSDVSPVRCIHPEAEAAMIAVIEKAKSEGNTLGGVFEVFASGAPLGLGSYSQWDRRIEAEIGRAFLSLNAIKGVEIGLGFQLGEISGSEAHDPYFPGSGPKGVVYQTNRSGGIDGGMTTGQNLCIRAVMKPLATLMKPVNSVDLRSGEAALAHIERSDVCAVPAAAVIGESLLALILTGAILEKFGGDSMEELVPRVEAWTKA